jgi:uncharacterized protein YutD
MAKVYRIEIMNDLMMLLDDENNGCDAYVLRSYKAAKRKLARWREMHDFDENEALRLLGDFFQDANADTELAEKMAKIAKLILNIPTLECRNMDSLDFHELHVAEIELALRLAYEVGRGSVH